ncbi:O-antigen ligase family protein [Desulfogranum marinum]|uniref:O-antigen ligase family protein n=1 Tax=Desulfogranum marinum TaxID=453220 RepID=UPI0029C6141E|nr:O-antigen ligase family protein [Desulfogranum marinum]
MIFIYLLIVTTPFSQYPAFYNLFAGLSLVKIFGILSFTYSIFYRRVESRPVHRSSTLEFLIVVFFLYGIFRIAISNEFGENYIFQTILSLLIFFFVSIRCIDSIEKVKKSIICIIVGVFFATYRGLKEYFYLGIARPQSVFGDPNYFALALVLCIIILLNFIFYSKLDKNKKIFIFLLSLIMIATLLLTASRGGVIGLLVGLLVFLLSEKVNRKKICFFLFISLFFIVQILPSHLFGRFGIGNIIDMESEMNSEMYGAKVSTDARKKLLIAGVNMVKEKPIFGVGHGKFKYYSVSYNSEISSSQIAHCTWLEILAEQGIFGFIIFISIIYLTLERLLSVKRLTKNTKCYNFISISNALFTSLVAYVATATFLSAEWEKLLWIIIFISICFYNCFIEKVSSR